MQTDDMTKRAELTSLLRDAQLAFMSLRTFAHYDERYIADPNAPGSAHTLLNWPWLDGWFERTRKALEVK